jgi:hypothetical protein
MTENKLNKKTDKWYLKAKNKKFHFILLIIPQIYIIKRNYFYER